MPYDALAESIILIGARQPQPVPRLSRRRRFAAMAVDVSDDIAATMFLRRSVGCDVQETWVLTKRETQWSILGGGGGTIEHDAALLADRPAVIHDDAIWPWNTLPGVDPHIATGGNGAGGVHDSMGGRDLFPWSGRWISYTTLYVTAQVEAIDVADRRLAVPWHGNTLITWPGRNPPRIALRGTGGKLLATAQIPTSQP